MNPLTHFLAGWSAANIATLKNRDRILVAIGGVLPDIDSFGIIPEILTDKKLDWFSRYHHVLAHNILVAVIGLAIVVLVAKRKLMAGALFFLAFHIHLLCDILGGKGPDGYQWPIPYLWPFLPELQITWQYQWALNAWPNFAITIFFVIVAIWLARNKGYSFVGIFSRKADEMVVATIRKRLP
jgi:hypothetical protein